MPGNALREGMPFGALSYRALPDVDDLYKRQAKPNGGAGFDLAPYEDLKLQAR